jgi:hypothetical protein
VTTAALADGPFPEPAAAPARRRVGLRQELLLGLAVAAALAALGLPLGLLWRALAPKVEFVMTEAGATPMQPEPEGFVADDGWYAIITFAAGVLAAILVWLVFRRRRGPIMLLALVVGSIAAGVLTAWLGRHIGYAHYRELFAHAPVGTHFFRPPDVRSAKIGLWFGFLPRVQGAALLQATAAATAYLVLAAFHVEPDLRRPDDSEYRPLPDYGPAGADPRWEDPDGDRLSWGPTASTAPPAWPAPPGSAPAEPPRD